VAYRLFVDAPGCKILNNRIVNFRSLYLWFNVLLFVSHIPLPVAMVAFVLTAVNVYGQTWIARFLS
jgi:hypothetical protein